MNVKTNDDVLAVMCAAAEARRTRLNHQRMRELNAYIRVNGQGFRAVSVAPDSPLSGFSRGSRSSLDAAVEDTENKFKTFDADLHKDERSLQAHIIRKALEQGGDLLHVLGEGLPFSKLVFAFDEVSLNESEKKNTREMVRCDLLAVAQTKEGYEPAIIELKYKLDGTQVNVLDNQLGAFARQLFRYAGAFERLFKAATGHDVIIKRVHRVIVWPHESGDTAAEARLGSRLKTMGICAVACAMEPRVATKMRAFGEMRVVAAHSMPTGAPR